MHTHITQQPFWFFTFVHFVPFVFFWFDFMFSRAWIAQPLLVNLHDNLLAPFYKTHIHTHTNTHKTEHSPEGGSTMTLQPGTLPAIQQVHQHKWPLRPGVQVHVNGTNSLTLATSGSVLLSPNDLGHQSDASNRSRSSSTGSQSSQPKKNRSLDNQLTVETGSNPYYETLREKKRNGSEAQHGNQATDSGSESTRSVIRVQGPSRPKNNITLPTIQIATAEPNKSTGRFASL